MTRVLTLKRGDPAFSEIKSILRRQCKIAGWTRWFSQHGFSVSHHFANQNSTPAIGKGKTQTKDAATRSGTDERIENQPGIRNP